MKTETEWQVRALQYAELRMTHSTPLLAERILDFAREYAADLRAQHAEWVKQNGPGGWIDDLRAQLAAAGPVKVPNDMIRPLDAPRGMLQYNLGKAEGWNACIAEVLRLNAPPKENG